MNKPMVKEQTKKRPGHFILTSQGWVKVLRGNRHVKWEGVRQ